MQATNDVIHATVTLCNHSPVKEMKQNDWLKNVNYLDTFFLFVDKVAQGPIQQRYFGVCIYTSISSSFSLATHIVFWRVCAVPLSFL